MSLSGSDPDSVPDTDVIESSSVRAEFDGTVNVGASLTSLTLMVNVSEYVAEPSLTFIFTE